MTFTPCLVRSSTANGEFRFQLGHPLLDRYLEFVAGRARSNNLRAVAFDLKAFFIVVNKDPEKVQASDVFDQSALQAARLRWGLDRREPPDHRRLCLRRRSGGQAPVWCLRTT